MPRIGVDDPALPGLATALDGDLMLPHVAAALGVEPQGGLRCTAEVLAHKEGKRCSIRYTLSGGVGVSYVFGKLYGEAHRAERGHRWLGELAAAFPDGAVRLPAALAVLRELGIALQGWLPGEDVRHALAAGAGARPLALAAEFLARLHSTPPLEGLRALPLAKQVEKSDARRAAIEAAGVAELSSRAALAHERLVARAQGMTAPAALTHKDFYYAHVLWDGECIAVIDFDELKLADPAFDVAHFHAHLANLAYRQTGRPDAYAREGGLFFDAYCAAAGSDVRDRLPWYRAYTFLKLAATEVRRRRDGWQARTDVLLDLAGRALDET